MSRNPIQDNFVILCAKLNLEKLLPYLRQERMITQDEYEILTNPNLTTKAKREKLLIWLPRKGRNYFVNFGKCLVWSGQTELARHIGVDVAMVPEPPFQLPAEPSPEEQQQQMFNMLRSMMQQTPTTRSSTAVPQLNSAPQQHSAPLATVAAQPAVTQPAVTFQPSSSAHQPSPDTGPHVFLPGGSNHVNSPPIPSHAPAQPSAQPLQSAEPMELSGTLPLQHPRQDMHVLRASTANQEATPDAQTRGKVFILYCKDNLPESFCDDVLDLADILRHCGFDCMVDHYVDVHPPNWNIWTEQKIKESQYVLLVYSPTLAEWMKSPQQHTLHMAKGKYYSNMVVNFIHPPKVIPVYLNQYTPGNLEWLPSQMRMYSVYHLNVAQLGQAMQVPGDTSEDIFRQKLEMALHDPRFREVAGLVYHLRNESDAVPPDPARNPINVPPSYSSSHVPPHPSSGGGVHHQPYSTAQHLSHPMGSYFGYGVQPESAQLHAMQQQQQPNGLQPTTGAQPANESLHFVQATQVQEMFEPDHITDHDVRRIGQRIKKLWYSLGIKLGVESAQLDVIQDSLSHSTNYEEAALNVVYSWRQAKRASATRQVLKQALIDLNFGRLAQEIFQDE